jgi:NADP-dependent 3-hydroxy acid dehydrogenase YdfG
VAQAALPIMRAQRDGVLIHTSSWAGRWIGPVSGPAYTAAKHGMVAMSHTINLEECLNGIRSSVLCPNEVATPIMANRPVPEKPETLARMLQPQDMGELIVFIARQPPHVCINEVMISPTHNRGYIGQMQARQAQMTGQAT